MPKITFTLSDDEYKVLNQYARQCGEELEELVKKICINDATFIRHEVDQSGKYYYEMDVPDYIDAEKVEDIVRCNYNNNRKILGMKKIIF